VSRCHDALFSIKLFGKVNWVRLLLHPPPLMCMALQVTATRKGVRNQLKNLLWRSKSSTSDAPKAAGGVDMSLGGQTVEGQLRSLADLAFLMQVFQL